jgi:hypothetical protein
MGTILLLALAAAVYPQLLAVVVVILTRPNPKPLLWACYLAALVVSVGSAIAIVAVFRSRGTIAGTSSRSLGPSSYMALGAIALLLAILIARRREREPTRRDSGASQGGMARKPGVGRLKSRADRALREGSLVVAGLVGALLAVPGPFDFLALGHLARSGYGPIAAGAIIIAFALIKFVLIEVPIASYAMDSDGTAARVGRFSAWMRANKLSIIAVVVGVIGLALLATGISRLR